MASAAWLQNIETGRIDTFANWMDELGSGFRWKSFRSVVTLDGGRTFHLLDDFFFAITMLDSGFFMEKVNYTFPNYLRRTSGLPLSDQDIAEWTWNEVQKRFGFKEQSEFWTAVKNCPSRH